MCFLLSIVVVLMLIRGLLYSHARWRMRMYVDSWQEIIHKVPSERNFINFASIVCKKNPAIIPWPEYRFCCKQGTISFSYFHQFYRKTESWIVSRIDTHGLEGVDFRQLPWFLDLKPVKMFLWHIFWLYFPHVTHRLPWIDPLNCPINACQE